MRNHGVTSFPDPKVTSTPGQQSISIGLPRALAASPTFKAAQKACSGILPMPSPAQQAQQQHAEEQGRLGFARCMRSHGVTAFPDPTPEGHLSPQMIAAAGVDLHAPAVATAAKACVSSSAGTITLAQVEQAVGGAP
jgi:hypothetical protein